MTLTEKLVILIPLWVALLAAWVIVGLAWRNHFHRFPRRP